ncbi:MAG: T9SS type A sorting domain-containing protein [Saprospiraceae bacterium]|nr:T9SS type A sorting domain-containing protein [Saprospiraceae bacterium]
MKKLSLLILFIIINPLVIFSQNNALDFDGTDDYVLLPNNLYSGNLQGGTEITIEYWFKGTQLSSAVRFQDGSGNYIVAGWLNSGTPYFIISNDGGTAGLPFNVNIQDDYWHHIACVWKSNTINGFQTYIDGVLTNYRGSAYVTLPAINFSNGGSWLGTINVTSPDELLNGTLDEVRIWKVARTQSEIRQNMYRELPNPAGETNLVAYYKFNETSGTSLADSKGSNTGTLTNYGSQSGYWQTSTAFFGPKNCLDFDGSDDYIECGNNASITSFNNFTMEAWVKLDDANVNQKILGKFKDWDNYYILGVGFGKHYSQINAAGNEINFDYGYVPANTWTHLAVTFSKGNGGANGTCYGYVNGEVVYSKTDVADAAISVSNAYYPFRIGLAPWDITAFKVNGQIDEVRIWNTARTATEIRENIYKSLTGNETGLVAYYNFDNNSGSTLQDFSGNGNDGILTNMDNSDWVSSSAFNTWLNTSSSSWATISNWSAGSTPLSGGNVGIYSLSNSFPTISGTPTVDNMYIGNGATVTVSSNFTVNNNLLLDEDLNMNGNIVNIGSDGKLIENNGLLCGCSGYSCHTQTLDNISCLNIAGLGAEITTTANMGSTDVYRYHAAITGPTGDEGINRFYKILPTTNTGLNATLVFHYDDSELNGCTESNLVLFKSTNNGQTWSQVGGTINTTDNTITLTSIDGFSWWTAAEGGSTLPIELISFNGIYIKEQIELNWQTVSEMNNEAFIIERSENGTDFSKIAEIPGSANSNEIVKYNYNDLNVERNKIYYYKLSDRSFNGNVKERKTIYVSTGIKNDNISYQVFPNPFSDNLNIIIKDKNDYIKIKLLNSSGLEVANIFEGKTTKNGRHISWNCFDKNQQKITKGIYFLEIETNGGIKTEKLILQ